ncbi:I66 family serine proteinase inhibitor [Nonomuraea guangzhouensis]|uniref:I66 family serine proteinase inhibitor n=1 Tax=Nonomuraea guangzhouensis TaxID=1291555 RepID=A0ABW4GTC0_9ACTN|nr:I66 family serine proteinase inhibitor [Nonomuraea guangzhouensis]
MSGPGQIPPYSTWTVEPLPDESDEFLTIRLAGTDRHIGRHFAEDRSLLPKRVLLLPPGVQAQLWTIEPVG